MTNMKKQYISIVLVGILSASMSVEAASYPDSINSNTNLNLNIAHKVNGKAISSNPLVNTNYGSWTPWETSSDMFDCTKWTPETNTVKYGQKFEQYRNCQGEETRSRTVIYTYANGTKVTKTETETELSLIDDGQYAIGTKNYVTKETTEYTVWADTGSLHSCTSWTPNANQIEQGKKFTQKSDCKQDQNRTKTIYNHWANGSKTVKSTNTETRTLDESRSRTTTGTKVMSYWKTIFSGTSYDPKTYDLTGATKVKATIEYDFRGRNNTDTVTFDVPTRLTRYFSSHNTDTVDSTACGRTTCVAGASVYGEASVYGTTFRFKGGFDEEYKDGAYASAYVRLKKVEALYSN